MSLLDFIYPKRCAGCGAFGSYLCSRCFTYIVFAETGFCGVCQRAAIGGFTHPGCRTKYEIDGIFASVSYSGVVKRLLHKMKYKPYILDIRGLLTDLFYEGIIQKESFVRMLEAKNLFLPIPLHKLRMQQRGYNQSEVLAVDLVRKFQEERMIGGVRDIMVVQDMLYRKKQTLPQYGLLREARVENLTGAFDLRENFRDVLKNFPIVFLIDDIVTTGATLREAARVLKRAGAGKVYGLALAHGQ